MNPTQSATPVDETDLARLVRQLAEAEAALHAHLTTLVDAPVDQDEFANPQQHLLAHEDLPPKQAGIQTAILNALPSHIALIDATGMILAVNYAWRCYARESAIHHPLFGMGQNYLTLCEQAKGVGAADARVSAAGLRRILNGEITHFSHEFANLMGTVPQWFLLTISRLGKDPRGGAIITHIDITERKATELALQESEEHFRATFERVAVGVAHVAADGRFTRVNDRLCSITGYTRDEMLQLSFFELSFLEDQAQTEDARVAMLADTQTFYTAEKRYRQKNGDTIWINLVTTLVRDQAETPPYFISVIEDITSRKNAELHLKRLNRLYVVLSRVGEAIVRIRTPHDLYEQVCQIMVNDGLLRMALVVEPVADSLAIRPVAVFGERGDYLAELVTTMDDNAVAQGTIGTALKTGQHDVSNNLDQDPRMLPWREAAARNGYRAAASFPLKLDGTTVASLVLFADEVDYFREDEITLMVTVATNISFAMDGMHKEQQRLAGEESLRERELHFRALIEHSTDGIMLVDANDRILYLSPAVKAIEGYSQEELLGRAGMENTHPEDLPLVREVVSDLLANPGKSMPFLWRRRHKNGKVLWIEGATTNLLADPAVRAIVTNYRDVTERRRTETDIRQSQALLGMASRLGRIGAWAFTSANKSLFWSDEVRVIHEVPTDYVPQIENALDFYPVEYRAMVSHTLEQCLRDGSPFDFEVQIMTAKGRRVWVRTIGEAMRDDEGAIRGAQGAFQDITERKQAAEETRQVAERLTTTFESITDSFFTLDRDWRFTYVNRQAELAFSRTRLDLLGKVFWDEFPAVCETVFHHEFQRAIAENVAVQIEDFSTLFNAWIEVRAYPSAQGLAVYFRDVSDQRKAHEDLFASEERFRLLAKATNDAIWDYHVVSDQIWWNAGFETLFGYPRHEAEPTLDSWTKRLHPGDHVRVTNGMQLAIAQGDDIWSDEYQFRRKDGSYAYVLNRSYIIRDAAGGAIRIIGGMTDLTARRKSEERIAEQAALLDEARDAITVRDMTHHIAYWNKSAERLYGWTAEEAVGRSARDLLYPDASSFDKAVVEVVKHGEWVGELSPTSKDGSQSLIEERWTLVREAAGKPPSILAISTDITGRRKLEQQFLRAQRLESIGTLAGGIAHDLNNVLAPITLSINLLTRGETDVRRLGILSIIDSSAKRGADMVKQVLSFARGVDGQRLPVQIPVLLREIEKIINDTFLKNIQVCIVMLPGLWPVSGDSTQLHQVLLNLCVNARDAMPDGGTLTLTAENVTIDEHFAAHHIEAKPGPYVSIQVEDSGTGIPAEILEKIFEPFFTTKEVGKGTGLGLSTSLAVIKSHGGFLRVYSEHGKGTAFKMFVPALTTTSATDHIIVEDLPLPRGQGELVLVVDDEYALRQLTRQTLEAFGYRVLLASDGSEAVALYAVQQAEIALVLTDMMMPVMDGNATIRVLMKIRPGVRIIAASGLSENQVISKAISSGVKHFLTKPYTTEALLTKVRDALS